MTQISLSSLHIAALCMMCSSLFAQTPEANSAKADFSQNSHYAQADQNLLQSGSRVKVVFLGDSITEYWGSRSGAWFSEEGWINRGIGGQTSAQLLLRERSDAINLHPEVIVLEAGSNDMRLGFKPEEIREHFLTMGELAEFNHIAVFVETMTPTCDCFRPVSGLRTVERIRRLNELLSAMCIEKGWKLIDVSSPLVDSKDHMQKELTVDGVHPNNAGYSLMAPIIEEALKNYRGPASMNR
jgi:lysophospholipase L1-like esterase